MKVTQCNHIAHIVHLEAIAVVITRQLIALDPGHIVTMDMMDQHLFPPVLHRVTKSIPTLFSATSNEEYPGNLPQPVNTSLTSGKSSSSSEKEKPAEVEKTVSQLYGFNDSEGSDSHELLSDQAAAGAVLAPDYLQAQDRIDADDDSSAGSSGWESSDGDSSVRTGSVESFDPNVESLGTSISPSHDGTASYLEEEMEDRQLMLDSLNPAVNPVVQRR